MQTKEEDMRRLIVNEGDVFNYLRIIKEVERSGLDNRRTFLCVCKCGNQIKATLHNLKTGNTNSCGCYMKEKTSEAKRTHGLSKTKMYDSWRMMKERCNRKENKDYPNYGGRGIKVCDEWENSYQTFYDDMGESFVNGLTIDRIDTNLGYCKENCKWSTQLEQQNNRRNNVRVGKIDEDGNIIAYFASFAEAGRSINVNASCIESACKGRIKTSGGFRWKILK